MHLYASKQTDAFPLPDEKPEATATGSKSPLQGLSSAQFQVPGLQSTF